MRNCPRRRVALAIPAILIALAATAGRLEAADWYVGPEGTPQGRGTQASPWDLTSALAGRQPIVPGDTVWIAAGTYRHPDRSNDASGYQVRLAGRPGNPIHVRAASGRRVTIDGGLAIVSPATWLWIWDLEIIVSENLTMPRRVEEPGSHPRSYNRPWGGLNVYSGEGCKYINLVIHDNAQGVSFWSGATDSELYGTILYDNGWDAPDRGHGHAVYTQNQHGTKTIADCLMTGGYSYTMHAYGSARAYVDNYLVEGNFCYDAGTFLLGGGRPSRGLRVLDNCLYGVSMQLGYTAPENDDCVVRGNTIVNGGLAINKFKTVVKEDNLVLGPNDPRPEGARVVLRPNRYDPNRANLAIYNWSRQPAVEVEAGSLLAVGDRYRLLNPRDVFGEPVLSGVYDGKPIRAPVEGEFAAFVMLKAPKEAK